jgi:hypothetical protein
MHYLHHPIRMVILFSLSLGIFFNACKKEEIPGPKGDPGTPGGGGNSNISSTSEFTITTSQWVTDTVNHCLKVELNFPEITSAVVNSGGVKVFTRTGATWHELPYTTGDLFTQFAFREGWLILNYINIETGYNAPPGTGSYRMVIFSEAQ